MDYLEYKKGANEMASNPNKLVLDVEELKKGKYSAVQIEYTILTSAIADNSTITIPLTYQVGNNSLQVYVLGERLIKVDGNKDGHYKEVGTAGSTSNQIQFNNIGQSIPVGTVISYVVTGDYS